MAKQIGAGWVVGVVVLVVTIEAASVLFGEIELLEENSSLNTRPAITIDPKANTTARVFLSSTTLYSLCEVDSGPGAICSWSLHPDSSTKLNSKANAANAVFGALIAYTVRFITQQSNLLTHSLFRHSSCTHTRFGLLVCPRWPISQSKPNSLKTRQY
jgi:hypothetical protein